MTKGLDKDPHVDLALVAASALFKLSGLAQSPSSSPSRLSPLSSADPRRVLQAAMLLAAQLSRTPDEMPLRLLLVQVYLLLGTGSLARSAWVPTDVKRTIQDALSPLFFDRLSGVAPGLFQHSGAGRHDLTEPLASYYSGCLRDRSPVKIWDAFAAGSYSSILDMAAYSDRLRRSCTLVMAVVEERRAARALGGKIEGGIEQAPLLGEFESQKMHCSGRHWSRLTCIKHTSRTTRPLSTQSTTAPSRTWRAHTRRRCTRS